MAGERRGTLRAVETVGGMAVSDNGQRNEEDGTASNGVYCMRCRVRRPLQDAHRVVLRSGRPVLKGHCAVCKGPLFSIGIRVQRGE